MVRPAIEWIFREWMQPPQDIDWASAHEHINDPVLKDKIVNTLTKVIDLNWRIFELLWRKWEIYVQIQHGPSIYLEQGKDYRWTGDALRFLPQSLQTIRSQVDSYNEKANVIKRNTRQKLSALMGEIESTVDNTQSA